MIISLLPIVVPTILILAVLILVVNSRNKRVMDEIGGLKEQLEKLDNRPAASPVTAVKMEQAEEPVSEPVVGVNENEEQDAPVDEQTEPGASAYNTGKSGKIYTKEELELLIKE